MFGCNVIPHTYVRPENHSNSIHIS
uniref:Uncharacterized protein n=1 Tax=Lepeophtheirus salmonis TaxID=72036 RepID=A0A0K2T633_LEPSM